MDPLLIYSTYVGGSGDDSGNAIAVDGSGDAFVAEEQARRRTSLPQWGRFRPPLGAVPRRVRASNLPRRERSLTYSTLLGGSGDDVATGLALAKDNSGDVFVVGSTGSTNFPTTAGTIQTTIKGASNGFVTKVKLHRERAGLFHLPRRRHRRPRAAVAVDASNNAYVTGSTQNSTFPTTSGAFQTTCGTAANCNGGLYDAFVSVIKPDGSGFVYSTFLGGSNADQGLGIAVDSVWRRLRHRSDALKHGLPHKSGPSNPRTAAARRTRSSLRSTRAGVRFYTPRISEARWLTPGLGLPLTATRMST